MIEPKIPKWKWAWRVGFEPQMSLQHLVHLRTALSEDNPELMQKGTTEPPPLTIVFDWQVEKACATIFGYWKQGDVNNIGDAHDCFARVCFEADERLGEPAACRFFLNWWDETDREQAIQDLAQEINSNIVKRASNHERSQHV